MLQDTTLRSLHTLLPKGQVFTDRASLIAYEVDGGLDRGLPEGVVFPRTAEEMAQIVRWAAAHNVPLVARGAGTGLSGGAVADRGGLIVEFAHMNRILTLDLHGRSATVQPAVINLALDEQARAHGLYFPPDPSSQRASTLGGNVAENSGGPHCFKYGVTTNYVTGLDVVLADGSALRVGGRAQDYPEYDLCGLITGSEGTLAMITAISVRLLRNPPGVKTMLAIFDGIEEAGEAVSAIIAAGLMPATMEMMDRKITGIIEPFAHAGLPLDAEAILIIEVDGYPESLSAQIDEIGQILQRHHVRETRVSSNEEERYKIWLARKSAAGAITRLTPAYYTVDITVPRSCLKEILAEVNLICERHEIRTGHLLHAGDGNLHPMLLIPDPSDPELMRRIHQTGWEIVKCCVSMNGSLTGEHGVGIEKREYMSLMHTGDELMTLWDIKQAFDPAGIFNPGKVFPTSREPGKPFAGYVEPVPIEQRVAEVQELPGSFFAPTTEREAAQGLLALSQAARSVCISGDGNKPELRAGKDLTILSTSALRGIKNYAPDDLYVTAGAGTTITELQAFLAQENKQVPLAVPWSEATIGGLVAANVNAPLRMRYGSLRDNVLCATVALPDGRLIRAGRPLVKNVAGYDLVKVFIGSQGTLGLLTDITLKLIAPPRARRTLFIPVETLQDGLTWAGQILPLAIVASAVVLCKGAALPGLEQSPYVLAYTAEGMPEDVEAELAQVRHALRSAGAPKPNEGIVLSGTDLWLETQRRAPANALHLRTGVASGDLAAYLQKQAASLQETTFAADMSSGIVHIVQKTELAEARQWLEDMRGAALKAGGYAVITDMPREWVGKDEIERRGYQPDSLKIVNRLKERWDPRGILPSW